MGQQREMTLAGVLKASAAKGDSPALLLDRQEVSFCYLAQAAETRARQMMGAGVRSGDRVGVLLPNGVEYVEIMLGAALIGAVCVPMNVRYKARELKHLIVDSGMSVLYTQHYSRRGGFRPIAGRGVAWLGRRARSVAPRSDSRAQAESVIIALDNAYPRFLPEDRIAPFQGDLPEADA